MSEPSYPEIVHIVWDDAQTSSSGSWISWSGRPKPMPVHTVGYVIERTEDFITVTLSVTWIDGVPSFGPMIAIPAKWVKSVTSLLPAIGEWTPPED